MKRKIMVIEDDEVITELLIILLEREGYEVIASRNGLSIEVSPDIYPDLYLLDMQISGTDGLLICRTIKSNPATAHIPVLMISANANIDKLAADAGADGYIEKPFDIKYLVKKVGSHLR